MDRLTREKETVSRMISLFCQKKHHETRLIQSPHKLCENCQALEIYAHQRLEHCRWHEQKPACSKCTTHCYAKKPQAAIREVMKYSGPRMLFKQPYFALMHIIDVLRSKTPHYLQ